MDLQAVIRDIPDFPKKGVIYKDITPLLNDYQAFSYVIDELKRRLSTKKVDVIVGIESRGFIFGAALAYAMGISFVPVRKFGKLPSQTIDIEYELEYGTDKLSIHADALKKGQNVAVIDDVLATGGTAHAVTELVRKAGGNVTMVAFLVELSFLGGNEKLNGYEIFSLIKY